MSDTETELRALWTSQGVPIDRQNELIADIKAKAAPGAAVGPFVIPARRFVLVQCVSDRSFPGCVQWRATCGSAEPAIDMFFWAADRIEARGMVLDRYPDATFYGEMV